MELLERERYLAELANWLKEASERSGGSRHCGARLRRPWKG
jgi:hypothetical protein